MDYPRDNVFTFLFSTYRRTAGVIAAALLIITIPVTLYLINQNQDIRQRAAGGQLPGGYFDGVDNTACSVNGWAYDPDEPTKSVSVHVYKDGPGGNQVGTLIGATTANIPRPDVNAANVPGDHGFNMILGPETGLHDGQPHKIWIYAIDSQGGPNAPLANAGEKSITCAADTSTTVDTTITPIPSTAISQSPASCTCNGINLYSHGNGQYDVVADAKGLGYVNSQQIYLTEGNNDENGKILLNSNPINSGLTSEHNYRSFWNFSMPKLDSTKKYRIRSQISCSNANPVQSSIADPIPTDFAPVQSNKDITIYQKTCDSIKFVAAGSNNNSLSLFDLNDDGVINTTDINILYYGFSHRQGD